MMILLACISCQKSLEISETTIVYGIITDSLTELPLEHVEILKVSKCVDRTYADTTLLTKTNAEGYFEIKTPLLDYGGDPIQRCYEYLIARFSNYEETGVPAVRGAVNNTNIQLVKSGWIGFHVINVNSNNLNDRVQCYINPGTVANLDNWEIDSAFGIDTMIYFKVYPNYLHYLHWQATNDSTIFVNDEVFCPSGDTTPVSIIF